MIFSSGGKQTINFSYYSVSSWKHSNLKLLPILCTETSILCPTIPINGTLLLWKSILIIFETISPLPTLVRNCPFMCQFAAGIQHCRARYKLNAKLSKATKASTMIFVSCFILKSCLCSAEMDNKFINFRLLFKIQMGNTTVYTSPISGNCLQRNSKM